MASIPRDTVMHVYGMRSWSNSALEPFVGMNLKQYEKTVKIDIQYFIFMTV